MATSVRLIRRYAWLVEIIRRAGRLTLDQINDLWFRNYTLNFDHEKEIPDRTFHRHREAIAELFDVEIVCDRATNTYYIKNSSELDRPSFTSWLFNGLALDNLMMGHESLKRRIKFEEAPAGVQYLPLIVEAIATNRVLSMTYQSYNNMVDREWRIEPRGLKQHSHRWYLIGHCVGEESFLTFALDRIVNLELTDMIFEPDDSEEFETLFSEVVGVLIDPELDAEDVVVRIFGKQRRYFESSPLHHSQKLLDSHAEYSDYQLHLRPEYEFQHEILRLGPAAEVISPQWLRDEMKWNAEEMLKHYFSNDE